MTRSQPHNTTPSPIRLEIHDVGFGGAGVGRAAGKIVFVPLTIDGETIEAEIVEQRKGFDRARLAKVILGSPFRVNPPCPYFGHCGGCDYQHIDYPYQLELKRRQVAQLLKRIGHLTDIEVSPTVGSGRPYHFRNRITVHASQGKIGFFAKNSRDVVDVESCAIAIPAVNELLKELRAAGLADGKHRTLRAAGVPRTFTQTNEFTAAALLDFVAGKVSGEVLLDAYCGSGFFGHALSQRLKKVIGIDWNAPAIDAARESAAPNETYICADVGQSIELLLEQEQPHSIILDPSADGLHEKVTRALSKSGANRLIYVSCNPATLARDLSRLQNTYKIIALQPFDMFPQTAEIESVAVLEGHRSQEFNRLLAAIEVCR